MAAAVAFAGSSRSSIQEFLFNPNLYPVEGMNGQGPSARERDNALLLNPLSIKGSHDISSGRPASFRAFTISSRYLPDRLYDSIKKSRSTVWNCLISRSTWSFMVMGISLDFPMTTALREA